MRDAISKAHRWLSEENRRRLPEDHVTAGLTCAAVRGESLYIAQAGPSLAYLCNSDGLRLIQASASGGLGSADDVDITLGRRALGPGAVLLIASSSLEDLAPPGVLVNVLRSGPEEAMQRLYIGVRGERHFSALLVAPSEPATHPPVPPKVKAKPPEEPWWRKIWRYLSPLFAAFYRLMLPLMGALLALALYPFFALLRFIGAIAHGIRSLLIIEEEDPGEVQAEEALAAEHGGQGAKASPARGKGVNADASRLQSGRNRGPVIALVVLAILVAGGLGALYLPAFMAQQAEIRFTTLVTQAEVLYQRGTAAADRDEARKHLREASSQTDNALAIHADDGKALELRGKLDAALEKVDALFQLSTVRMALDGATLQPAARELRRVAVQDNVLYLFDRGANGVYVYSLDADGSPKTLESPGFVPVAPSNPSGEIVDMFATSPGDTRFSGGVMFFDKSRSLVDYDVRSGFKPLTVRNPWDWASFSAARGYAGNLYVLDSKSRQVWRYIATDAGYDSEMKPLLEDVDMGDAFDFAVDGNIYVLNRLGQVFKFSNGQLQSFKQQGLDKPLSTPGAIFTAADAKSVYLADTGNKRVVTFDKDGRFQRQLVSNVIEAPKSLFVDERRGRIYILSGNKLYLAGLPK